MPTARGRAPAKVNLGLKVLELRADGYHEIRTVYQTVSLTDGLRLHYRPRSRRGIELSCNWPKLATAENLAARAAQALLDAGPWQGHVALELDKRIPIGSGLGGGSSDAAWVLRALARLLKPPPSPCLLFEVAAALGSDVPFLLVGGAAVGLGRGEEVYPLPERAREWLLLLAPRFAVSTPKAYRRLQRARGRRLTVDQQRHMIRSFHAGISVSEDREVQYLAGAQSSCFENDFEEIVFQQYPELAQWKKRLVRLGASRAMLSGSGSAVFGVFPDRQRATAARSSLSSFPGTTYVVRTLSRRACRSVWDG